MVQARRSVMNIKPYVPGKPIEEVKRELGLEGEIVKLASNENPIGPSGKVMEEIISSIPELNIYPDDGSFYLKDRLSELWNIPETMILIGNGSAELIHYIATAFVDKGEEVILSKPSFIMGKICAQLMDANVKEIQIGKDWRHNLDEILSSITDKTKIIYIDNPNNPLGTYLMPDEMDDFLKSVPNHVIVVLDQAYYEYLDDDIKFPSNEIIKKYPNTVVLHTFSKVYGLAALRIGYALSSEEVINYLSRVRLPFNVNAIAQKAAIYAISDEEHVQLSVKSNEKGMEYLKEAMDKRAREYLPSYSNFLTIKTPEGGKEIFDRLQKKGVIIRPLENYGMHDWIRVSIGLKKELEVFVEKFDEVISEIKGE